jgi:antitoxin FitA
MVFSFARFLKSYDEGTGSLSQSVKKLDRCKHWRYRESRKRGGLMAQFTVQNLDEDIHQKLRDMAQAHGVSLEEFVHETLRKVALERTAERANLGSKIAKRFRNIGLQEPVEEFRSGPVTPLNFE